MAKTRRLKKEKRQIDFSLAKAKNHSATSENKIFYSVLKYFVAKKNLPCYKDYSESFRIKKEILMKPQGLD